MTISFSFCVLFWIALSLGMFIDNVVNVWGDRSYPLFWIGEILSLIIQWGFLFYLINIYGSPCSVIFSAFLNHYLTLCFQCCRVDSCCYTEPVRFDGGESDTIAPEYDSPAEDKSAQGIPGDHKKLFVSI